MYLAALSAAILGLYYTTEYKSDSKLKNEKKEKWADIDILQNGALESLYLGNGVYSELNRIVRPSIGRKTPAQSMKEWREYHHKMKLSLQKLDIDYNIGGNMKMITADRAAPRNIPVLPDPTFLKHFNAPNHYLEYHSIPQGKTRPDYDWTLYDDQYGSSTGGSTEGQNAPNMPSSDYFGNPWGVNGQLRSIIRKQHEPPHQYREGERPYRADKKVRFGGVSGM